uniref:Uncharacterized protein n=1 Tax=Lotharella globosa TaxID=91324 RepID=A0A7S3Z3C5_9EUKA|mmetsp:Transcript_6885/g.13513  ORF Transcript_6885/g.13513 Transcript_6885/m.13513 type:complete len:122 (-) Transcript_6885:95-460(-)
MTLRYTQGHADGCSGWEDEAKITVKDNKVTEYLYRGGDLTEGPISKKPWTTKEAKDAKTIDELYDVAVKEVSKDPDPDTKVYVYFHGPGPLLGILSTVSVNDLRYEDDANDVVSIITVSAS